MTTEPEPVAPGPEVFAHDSLSIDEIRGLEGMAAAAWPAQHLETLDGWTLRHTPGFSSRRVNSVLAHGLGQALSFEDRLAAVEAFYAVRDLPSRFQVTSASLPAGLAECLEARGYRVEAPVEILIAPVASPPPVWRGGETIEFLARADAEWLALYRAGYGRDIASFAASLPASARFPMVRDAEGAPLALGIGVVTEGWFSGFGLLTREDARGRGVGTALLAAMRGWGLAQGAFGAYLQVERHNDGARRLYERTGFRRVYGYHYRTLEP